MQAAPMQPYTRPAIRVTNCWTCDGLRWVIEKRSVSKALYACGYIDVAVKCSACGGTGRAPLPADSKLASAGSD